MFRITSTKLDRHQDRVLGLDAVGTEFRVPLLWNHDSWGPPIGYARCFKEGDEWLAELHFDRADDRSRVIADKVDAGSITTCSIGFVPSAEAEPVPNQEGGYDFPLVRVVELSPCNVPANEDAVRVRAVGTEDAPLPAAEMLKAYREAHAAFLSLASEMKSLVQALTRKAKSAKATEADEEDEEPADEHPEEAADESEHGEEEEDAQEAALGDEDEEPAEPEDKEAASVDAGEEEEDEDEPPEEAALEEEPAEEEDAEEPGTEEASADAEPTEAAADGELGDEEEEDEEDEEELKALRRRVAKGLGFSLAHVEALPSADVRAYAALLPSAP
ncbi:HK97 family phage prohead protease [Pyxidicoccus parkwayensis]|uniref:HK97 family phage prohead protease n=1 Tax=Pyxidicoccus parkwayensis TaxID=2813578 RepID=UPI001F5116D4|nr:HK97 family phage prohead protease [Pyxidicoccus parkwaysis]